MDNTYLYFPKPIEKDGLEEEEITSIKNQVEAYLKKVGLNLTGFAALFGRREKSELAGVVLYPVGSDTQFKSLLNREGCPRRITPLKTGFVLSKGVMEEEASYPCCYCKRFLQNTMEECKYLDDETCTPEYNG